MSREPATAEISRKACVHMNTMLRRYPFVQCHWSDYKHSFWLLAGGRQWPVCRVTPYQLANVAGLREVELAIMEASVYVGLPAREFAERYDADEAIPWAEFHQLYAYASVYEIDYHHSEEFLTMRGVHAVANWMGRKRPQSFAVRNPIPYIRSHQWSALAWYDGMAGYESRSFLWLLETLFTTNEEGRRWHMHEVDSVSGSVTSLVAGVNGSKRR